MHGPNVDQALLNGAVFWFQMSNIFGARLNHTTVDKTHLAVQLLSSCALLLHARNKFTDTLQWSLHWRLASRKHACCCQDQVMRNQCTHEQIPAVYTLFCLLVSITSNLISEIWSMLWICEHVSHTCSPIRAQTGETQACVKHRHGPKLIIIWESFRANDDFRDKHSFTWRHCTDVANRLVLFQFSNSLRVILGWIYWLDMNEVQLMSSQILRTT